MLYYVLFVTVSLILVQKLGVINYDQINKRVGFCESQDVREPAGPPAPSHIAQKDQH